MSEEDVGDTIVKSTESASKLRASSFNLFLAPIGAYGFVVGGAFSLAIVALG